MRQNSLLTVEMATREIGLLPTRAVTHRQVGSRESRMYVWCSVYSAYRSVPPPPVWYGWYTTFVAHGQVKDTLSVDWARTLGADRGP